MPFGSRKQPIAAAQQGDPAAGDDAKLGGAPQCPHCAFGCFFSLPDLVFGDAADIDSRQPAIQATQPLENPPLVVVVFGGRISLAQAAHLLPQFSRIAFAAGETEILIVSPDPARLAKVALAHVLQRFARLLQQRSSAGQERDIFLRDAQVGRMVGVNLDDNRPDSVLHAVIQHD